MAKKILQERNLNFSEIIIDNKPNLREEMEKKSLGRKTVPQIFFNNDLVGGYDDLNYLIEKDLLDEKLCVNDES